MLGLPRNIDIGSYISRFPYNETLEESWKVVRSYAEEKPKLVYVGAGVLSYVVFKYTVATNLRHRLVT